VELDETDIVFIFFFFAFHLHLNETHTLVGETSGHQASPTASCDSAGAMRVRNRRN
jgi:hypothetical protein